MDHGKHDQIPKKLKKTLFYENIVYKIKSKSFLEFSSKSTKENMHSLE